MAPGGAKCNCHPISVPSVAGNSSVSKVGVVFRGRGSVSNDCGTRFSPGCHVARPYDRLSVGQRAAAAVSPSNTLPTTRVTCGLRFPRRSILISRACSSARNALRLASGRIPQSCSIRLETIKVSAFRNPLRCQSASPTNSALTPHRLA